MNPLQEIINEQKIIASLRRKEDLAEIVHHPKIKTVFVLNSNIFNLPKIVHDLINVGKKVFVHMDLIEGLGKDPVGVKYLKGMGVTGIVTTKLPLIKAAKEEGLLTIQRLFMVDSEAVKTGLKIAKQIKPEAIEILPAFIPQYYLETIQKTLGIPTIAGGLIRTKEDVQQVFASGFDAISTSRRLLWNI